MCQTSGCQITWPHLECTHSHLTSTAGAGSERVYDNWQRDQDRMSVQSSWDNYSGSCVCRHRYDNNCAHFLSNALIQGGFSAIDGGSGADLRIVGGFCVCSSGRPIRAKELRSWFGKKWTRHSSPKDGINVVYQESHGQGHVLLKNYSNGEPSGHKGTGDYPNWATQEYYY